MTETIQPIVMTENARAKVEQLLEEQEERGLKLRIFISGGGCSGFQYGFSLDPQIEEGDIEIQRGNAILLVDATSIHYLDGAQVDYVEDLNGEQFVINNPNATTTCGCGSSFSV